MPTIKGYKLQAGVAIGGFVVELDGLVVWPTTDPDGTTPLGTKADAERVAARIPGALVSSVDYVLKKA